MQLHDGFPWATSLSSYSAILEMTLLRSREALEKIIREEIGGHHHYTCHIFCRAHWKIMGDKIMAWASQREQKPQPSREALEKIIHQRWQLGCKQSEIIEPLMAWATGQRERQSWCSHIRWTPFGISSTERTVNGKSGYWGYGEPYGQNICQTWTHCPICLTPRPGEG